MAQKEKNIIRFAGEDNNVLVHKEEITDFTAQTLLVVDASQQAVLYKDGAAEDPYAAGKYTLPTDNPSKFKAFFAKLFRRPQREGAPLTCDVYFVNTVNDISVGWGTPARIPVKDPVYNELVDVGANGTVKVKICDPLRFVLTVNGKIGGYTLDRLAATVRAEVVTAIKTHIAAMIVSNRVSLLEIHTELTALSEAAEKKCNERLADFGLAAVHLLIEDISIDEPSKQRLLLRIDKMNARSDVVLDSQAQTDADYFRTVRMADAKAKERELQGYSYQDEQYWATQREMAKHAAPPPVPPIGYAAPYGTPYGVPPYGATPPVASYAPPSVTFCAQCGRPLSSVASFCTACGAPVPLVTHGAEHRQAHAYAAPLHNGKCPRCGYPLLPRNDVCPDCGLDLRQDGKK